MKWPNPRGPWLVLTAAFYSLSPAQAAVQVLPLGDSITQGGQWVGDSFASYRSPLIDLLGGTQVGNSNSKGYVYDVNFIGSQSTTFENNPANGSGNSLLQDPEHEGHWGWRADEILNNTGVHPEGATSGSGNLNDWLGSYTPDVVLMHLGTNDAIDNDGGASFVSQTKADLGTIIDTLINDNSAVKIFMARLIPSQNGTVNTRITNLNAAISDLAAEKNAGNGSDYVFLVDQNSGFNTSTMFADDYHPNATGDQFMAEQWYTAMVQNGAISPVPEPATTSIAVAAVLVGAASWRRFQKSKTG